jgi:hypothetical protein
MRGSTNAMISQLQKERDMKTQQVTASDRLVAGVLWPLGRGRDAAAGEGRWAAKLKRKRVHYRCFDVATPEGDFVVEYRGGGMENELVLIDGQVASRGRSTWWYTPYFRFRIGTADAVLAVGYWPWLVIRWLKLIVDGRITYSEGSIGHELPANELLRILADPLASDGIEIQGRSSASVKIPTNVICERQASRVTLAQRWFSWLSVMMVPFCILLDASVVAAYVVLPKGDLLAVSGVALLPGILVGLCATYYVLAKLVNRTVVTVTNGELSIGHGPLPWPGNQSIPVQQVKEFRCGKSVSRDYAGDVWETYSLSVLLADGRQIELLHEIGSSSAVHALAQEVTAWLVTAEHAAVAEMAV